MPSKNPEAEGAGLLQYAMAWGQHSLPPTLTATLILGSTLAQKPVPKLPLLFPPILLFSSYLNINGYQKDAAGISSAWSLAYLVLARRRKHSLRQKVQLGGVMRGTILVSCVANAISGGLVYAFTKREEVEE